VQLLPPLTIDRALAETILDRVDQTCQVFKTWQV